jgi:hypothetical protein
MARLRNEVKQSRCAGGGPTAGASPMGPKLNRLPGEMSALLRLHPYCFYCDARLPAWPHLAGLLRPGWGLEKADARP